MDFVFDRVAGGRVIKCLAIVDDATHESLATVAEHSIGGTHLTRILDQVCSQRGRPAVIRSDNGPEFTGSALLTWAHRSNVTLRLIEPGKPNQNAYVESLNGRLRDECLNEVHKPCSCSDRDRELAQGIQRRETEEETGRADARPVRKAVGHQGRYNAGQTLKPRATEEGVTSAAGSSVCSTITYPPAP
jgi:transposase InsO family protein